MFSVFRTEDLGGGLTLVEPPAGLLPHINSRLDEAKNEDNKLRSYSWFAIYLLACLHHDGKPVVSVVTNQEDMTIRKAFCVITDVEFKLIVDEFLFRVQRDVLEEWFDKLGGLCYITKKAVDTTKND